MADKQDIQPLLTVGPFNGLDGHTAAVYVAQANATDCSNADTHQNEQALCNTLGRAVALSFTPFLNGPIGAVVRLDTSQERSYYIAQSVDGTTAAFYDTLLNTYLPIILNGVFTQGVQVNGNLFLNNGQQIIPDLDGVLHVAQWQYPAPAQSDFSASLGPIGVLAPATYYYAFVRVVALPGEGGTKQYTSAVGANVPYPYVVTLTSAGSVALNGVFSAFTPDGYAYVTQVYRQSSVQPVWYLLTTLDSNSQYIDQASDASITANQVLVPDRDVPPVSATTYFPIEAHQTRLWILAYVNDADTLNTPQIQLWYSNDGQVWSFDAVNQVELIGDDGITQTYLFPPVPAPYGNQPMGVVQVGSYLLLFLTQTTWVVTGVDAATYTPYPLFNDIGCVAQRSITKGNGLVFWLSQQGAFSYDGASLSYLSDDVYSILQSLSLASLQSAVGSYADLCWYLSFPTEGYTLRYYLPKKTWTKLPYTMSAAVASPNLSSNIGPNGTEVGTRFGQIAAARTGTALVDAWLQGFNADLGVAPVVTWTTGISDSGMAWVQKDYQYVTITAPTQQTTLTVDFFCNPSIPVSAQTPSQSWTINLANGPTQVLRIPQEVARGYTCALRFTLQSSAPSPQQVVLWSATVSGVADRAYVEPTT